MATEVIITVGSALVALLGAMAFALRANAESRREFSAVQTAAIAQYQEQQEADKRERVALQSSLMERIEAVAELRANLQLEREARTELAREVRELRVEYQARERMMMDENARLQKRLSELSEKYETVSQQLADYEREKRHLTERVNDLNEYNQRLENERAELQSRVQRAEAELANLRQQIENMIEKATADQETIIRRLQDEVMGKDAVIADLRATVRDLREQLDQSDSDSETEETTA